DPDAGEGGAFSKGPVMAHHRFTGTATLLPNGKVLLLGGIPGHASEPPVPELELFDPITRKTSVATDDLGAAVVMSTPTWAHTATLLPSGDVVVLGGEVNGEQDSPDVVDRWELISEASTALASSVPSLGADVPASAQVGKATSFHGSGLTGISEATGGSYASS